MAAKYLGTRLRHPRRRHRPALPAPRERDGAVARRRAAVRADLDAQCLGHHVRREDEQVPRQFTARDERRRARAPGRVALLPRRPRTTAPRSSSPSRRWTRRRRAIAGSSGSRPRATELVGDDRPRPSRLPPAFIDRDGRRPRGAAGARACSSRRYGPPTRPSTQAARRRYGGAGALRAALADIRAMLGGAGLDPLSEPWASQGRRRRSRGDRRPRTHRAGAAGSGARAQGLRGGRRRPRPARRGRRRRRGHPHRSRGGPSKGARRCRATASAGAPSAPDRRRARRSAPGGQRRRALEGRGPDAPRHRPHRAPGRPEGAPGQAGVPARPARGRRAPTGPGGRGGAPAHAARRRRPGGVPAEPAGGASRTAPRRWPGATRSSRRCGPRVPATALYVAARVDVDERVREALALANAQGVPLLEAPRAEIDRITQGALHQGLALAACRRMPTPMWTTLVDPRRGRGRDPADRRPGRRDRSPQPRRDRPLHLRVRRPRGARAGAAGGGDDGGRVEGVGRVPRRASRSPAPPTSPAR